MVTTNSEAAAFYRQAQQAADQPQAVVALRLALQADPAFGLAIADLDSISEAPPSPISGRPMTWERHHIEIVRHRSRRRRQSSRRLARRTPRQRRL